MRRERDFSSEDSGYKCGHRNDLYTGAEEFAGIGYWGKNRSLNQWKSLIKGDGYERERGLAQKKVCQAPANLEAARQLLTMMKYHHYASTDVKIS